MSPFGLTTPNNPTGGGGGGGTYPSGQTPLATPSGMSLLFFDDFLSSTLNTNIWGVYDGTPGGTNGVWAPSHVVTPGNSLCNLQMYYDPANGVSASNYWVGGGMGAWGTAVGSGIPVGSTIAVAMRGDSYTPFYIIALLIGWSSWPPEIDFVEADPSYASFSATAHYGSGNSQQQINSPNTNLTDWHTWGVQWTTSTIKYTLDGSVWGSITNPDPGADGGYGLGEPQALSLQIQGDPDYPAENTSITASNPIQQQIDWVQVFVPS